MWSNNGRVLMHAALANQAVAPLPATFAARVERLFRRTAGYLHAVSKASLHDAQSQVIC